LSCADGEGRLAKNLDSSGFFIAFSVCGDKINLRNNMEKNAPYANISAMQLSGLSVLEELWQQSSQ
jgi:hypothetical protein